MIDDVTSSRATAPPPPPRKPNRHERRAAAAKMPREDKEKMRDLKVELKTLVAKLKRENHGE